MKLAIIANPAAGGGRAYQAVRQHIAGWAHTDWEVQTLTTRGRDDAGLLARQLLTQPPDLLAVCGGDGTVNEIVSHISGPPFPVAVLPAGTANVLARELGLPLNPIKALEIALRRTVKSVDVGILKNGAARRFLFVAGIGFDAFAVFSARPRLKKRLGMAAYVIAIVECFRNYSFPEFRVEAAGRNFKAASCLVCNAKSYGGGLLFCPDASMDDGLLDILILERSRNVRLAFFLLRAWLQKPQSGEWIHRLQARTVRIEGPGEVLVQTDGELAGCLPLEARLADMRFPLVVP